MPQQTENIRIAPAYGMLLAMHDLSRNELYMLKKLSTPQRVQDFLDELPMNFVDEYWSPRRVLRERKAQCMEGAMLAAVALRLQGRKPLVMDLKTAPGDDDHVVALFQEGGHWGAISKTNHGVLRYREPVYASLRELAMSYFHEYFLPDGTKTLRSYSVAVDLSRFDKRGWMTSEDSVEYIPDAVDAARHYAILTPRQIKHLRAAHSIERKMGELVEWKKP